MLQKCLIVWTSFIIIVCVCVFFSGVPAHPVPSAAVFNHCWLLLFSVAGCFPQFPVVRHCIDAATLFLHSIYHILEFGQTLPPTNKKLIYNLMRNPREKSKTLGMRQKTEAVKYVIWQTNKQKSPKCFTLSHFGSNFTTSSESTKIMGTSIASLRLFLNQRWLMSTCNKNVIQYHIVSVRWKVIIRKSIVYKTLKDSAGYDYSEGHQHTKIIFMAQCDCHRNILRPSHLWYNSHQKLQSQANLT